MRVFLDAGHNFAPPDTGASGFGLREQDVAFQVADTVRVILQKHGITVGMSRRSLSDILGRTVSESLKIRSRMSNDFKADYFISIHCNAFNGSALGTESFIAAKGGKRHELALRIHRQLVGLGLRDRSVKVHSKKLAVLHNTTAPAVLVELGFIDNANDNDILRNRQFDLATAVAKGILEQIGIPYIENKEDEVMDNNDTRVHWARKYLDNLIKEGIVETPEAWTDFESPVTKGLLLALVGKLTEHLRR